uniref:MRH domain-containing protein n=1 Tax=Entomoneis paludosa TaxID=265537 RepID=A0A7S2VCA8_9STRA
MGYVHERDANIAMADLKGMLETLRGDELARWIIYACQMAGEMADESNLKSKTCIPLRMAGLDSAVWWEPKTYEYTPIEKSDTEKNLLLAQIWDYNLKNPSNFIWHPSHLPKKTEKRRRLDEEYDDYEDYDDYHDHDYMDDEYAYDEEDDYDHDRYSKGSRDYGRNRNDNDGDSSEAKGENREQLLELIKGDPFSYTRTLFLNKSARMLEKIEEFQKKVDDATDDEEVAETPEDVEKSDREAQEKVDKEPELDFDPMALPMIKNQVKRRQEAIERGFDYAISAQVLLEKIDTSDESVDEKWFRLRTIAMSVINHGQLASIHVWQLYLSLMPELRNDVNLAEAAEAQTCVAPWATVCPPRKTTRPNSENTRFPFPPEPIFQDAVKYCDHLSSIQNAESICAADDTIPSELEDGHFGYYEISPRSQDDLITELFEGLEVVDNSPEREEILKMQEQVQKMEEDLEDVKAKIAEVEDSVGGKDGANGGFGLEGELHSIKNECFSFEAAKYVYELCMFKGAKQKEGKSHGGTHLGDWSSSKVADDSGDDVRRIWSWKKGTKCWNGPERSADAMVSCGATTRVLSADEPETCRYVFEVESPIACDEGFRAFHSL